MKMLTKFESKSSRAKGVAFHPTRPWILVSLHSSTIQLWDYRMGTLIDRFEEHEGSVRSVDFHPTQPLFVSGGDDYTVRVWSLDTRKCLFTLNGHLDYVRTVSFHHDLPWIISASDDQTIRIWNWQNRQEIACLTGHNHYVMSAQFHPSEDLVVSASLDQTVRVWDISGLRKKHSAPQNNYYDEQYGRPTVPQQDIFGNTDAVVKYILEGHDRGVNWASFHPRLPLIVSASDDRQVKLWRMSETKAWELDTCRGHTNNVLSAIFHPTQDLIISVGEDKTIRVWDLNKRIPVKQFRRDNDRFWLIAAHPNINLFAAAHDSGVMVFKLDRERPAHTSFQNQVYYVNNERQLQIFKYDEMASTLPVISLKKIGSTWNNFRSLSYNPSSRSILVTTGDQYALVGLPKESTGPVEPHDLHTGQADSAIFIARNRFVTFTKSSQSLEIKDLDNKTTKVIKLEDVKDVAYGGPGTVLLLKKSSVVHFDAQQQKTLGEVQANNVKYVSWSLDGQYLALLSKHTITIVNKKLETITSLHETIRIKSAAWEETGILFYSTLNHIKYTLLNGDNGIIKTLEETLYITKVIGKDVFALDRSGRVRVVPIDTTEYRFKKALVNKNFNEVLRLIKTSRLVGQNIIAYLQKSGYPEVALQFVQDPQTKFELALECGNLDIALQEAKVLNSSKIWEKLGQEALKQGNGSIVELVYQNQHHFDKLSFFYLITGDFNKLSKMEMISEQRGDIGSLIQNTFYNNSTEKRAITLAQAGQYPLAYAIAKTNGHDDLASTILEQSGLTEEDVVLPENELSPISLAKPSTSSVLLNWPLKPASLSYFEKAILGQLEDLDINDNAAPNEDEFSSPKQTTSGAFDDQTYFDDEAAGEEDEGWDLGDDDLEVDDLEDEEENIEIEEGSVPKDGELSHWVRNSKVAASYVATGAFEVATQLLNRQLGIVEFEPLRERFLQVYQSSKLYLPSGEKFDSIPTFVRSDVEEEDEKKALPFLPDFEQISTTINEGFKQFKANNLVEAIKCFRKVIYMIIVSAVEDEEDEDKAREALSLAREYILGLSIELKRRSLGPDEIQRNLELAAYFTKAGLIPAHRGNALQVAMNQSYKNKNFASASYFATEFLKIVSSGPRAEQASKIKAKSDSIARDSIEIDFNPDVDFDICASTFTPIYKGSPCVTDVLTGAKYQASEKGKLDQIALVSKIGAPASGLKIRI